MSHDLTVSYPTVVTGAVPSPRGIGLVRLRGQPQTLAVCWLRKSVVAGFPGLSSEPRRKTIIYGGSTRVDTDSWVGRKAPGRAAEYYSRAVVAALEPR